MAEPIIEITDLAVGYSTRQILSDVNIDIYKGELIGIIGPNGAGKSTFLKTIRGLLPRLEGSVKFLGKKIEHLPEKEFARTVAYLQQHVEVGFGYTGKEVVLAGRYPYMSWWQSETDRDEEIAMECMEYTGTAELADRPVSEVSGGQKQRILLAKVLAQQTPILFLDEPTTGLDMVYQEEIFRFAQELSRMGKTVLMVVHELNLASKYCDRILLLGKGKLLADGKPKDVFTEELLSYAYEADVEVAKNANTNSLEITTKINELSSKKRRDLLKKICNE